MRAMLVIDMQVGMLDGDTPPVDVDGVVGRINKVARALRSNSGIVIFVQHWGPAGDLFAPNSLGCEILPSLEECERDVVVSKTACDSFCDSRLQSVLEQHDVTELLIAGWATDFCVDTTVRAAASLGYSICVVADAHTCSNRAHLDAAAIIQHHNLTWGDLIVPGTRVQVLSTEKTLLKVSSSGQFRAV